MGSYLTWLICLFIHILTRLASLLFSLFSFRHTHTHITHPDQSTVPLSDDIGTQMDTQEPQSAAVLWVAQPNLPLHPSSLLSDHPHRHQCQSPRSPSAQRAAPVRGRSSWTHSAAAGERSRRPSLRYWQSTNTYAQTCKKWMKWLFSYNNDFKKWSICVLF